MKLGIGSVVRIYEAVPDRKVIYKVGNNEISGQNE